MPLPIAITFSRGIHKTPFLNNLIGVKSIIKKYRFFSYNTNNKNSDIVVGWGIKTNTRKAKQYAKFHNLPYLTLEDGFIRSVGLGVENHPPLSVAIDDLTAHYDATCSSRLEKILNNDFDGLPVLSQFDTLRKLAEGKKDPLKDKNLTSRARNCIDEIIENKLSKYNSSPDLTLEPTDKTRILVVDQTMGDLSIRYGLANSDSFKQMLNAAIDEHPDAEILVKIHPDVIAGYKQSHLSQSNQHPNVLLLSENCNPISLLEQVDQVYVVTSQLGFEALMAGKTVTCFGAPFYAGWGLTDDRVETPRRTQTRSIEELFVAAYILYCRYRDPETGERCEIERIIHHLSLQRQHFLKNSGTLFCFGFTPWKRGYVSRFLRCPWNKIVFVRNVRQIIRRLPDKQARIIVWGMRDNDKISELAKHENIPLWRMEDGFLRSVGLGSDFTAPASLVLDKQGIYFDPNHPSDLETLLENTQCTAQELKRAQSIRKTLVNSEISKYNVGERKPLNHSTKSGQTIILVPGQVEDDASIQLGCKDIRTNEQLLRTVRERSPNAYIIYKPHPDTLSGNRNGHIKYGDNANYDQLVTDISIPECLKVVDEVHTMTSLVGFEGLLRGNKVATYGVPFYAGWGLTDDNHYSKMRTRTLSIDDLVAGCMVTYPYYIHPVSKEFTEAESIINILDTQRAKSRNETTIHSYAFGRIFRKCKNIIDGLKYDK